MVHHSLSHQLGLVLLFLVTCKPTQPPNKMQLHPITHGPAAGELGPSTAMIWARSDRAGYMNVVIQPIDATDSIHESIRVDSRRDFTGKVEFKGLRPATAHRYRVYFSATPSTEARTDAATGTFSTAPLEEEAAAVSFAWGADVAGQNVCAHAQEGFAIFQKVAQAQPDFFIALGDMIYADSRCSAQGAYGYPQQPSPAPLATTRSQFWQHWQYLYQDQHVRRLLAQTPYFPMWDDHEVVNDFGPLHNTPKNTQGPQLLRPGLSAFLDYNPVVERASTPGRLYRQLRWGKHLQVFLLDTRQYRDANDAHDSASHPKTMLGREQLTWLDTLVNASQPTWTIVACSVPIAIPTGTDARDGWADNNEEQGFEQELRRVFDILRVRRNVLFITADVHFATGFSYAPYPDDPERLIYEFAVGPMNAGVFPSDHYDNTFKPVRLFRYGPTAAIRGWQSAKTWFNFGVVNIDRSGVAVLRVNNGHGKTVFEKRLLPR